MQAVMQTSPGAPRTRGDLDAPLPAPGEALCHRLAAAGASGTGHCDPAAGGGRHGQKELLLSSTDTQASQEAQVPNALTRGAAGV